MPDSDASPRGGRRRRRKARAGCRRGEHRYGGHQAIGGGILRRVCLACGTVTIDLTAAGIFTVDLRPREDTTT